MVVVGLVALVMVVDWFIACTTALASFDAPSLGLVVVVDGVIVVVVVVVGGRFVVVVPGVFFIFFFFFFNFGVGANHTAFHCFLLPASFSIWRKLKFGSTSINILPGCPIWNCTLIACFSNRWSGIRRMWPSHSCLRFLISYIRS